MKVKARTKERSVRMAETWNQERPNGCPNLDCIFQRGVDSICGGRFPVSQDHEGDSLQKCRSFVLEVEALTMGSAIRTRKTTEGGLSPAKIVITD